MNPIVKKESIKLSIEDNVSIETFVVFVKSGIELWTKAGEVLVKLVESNPNVYSQIMASNPAITFEMLMSFERMGRRQIYPPLLMDNSPAAKVLMSLSYELQEKYCNAQLEVLTNWQNGQPIIQKKYLKEMNAKEARLVFDGDGARDIEKQKSILTQPKVGRKPYGQNKKFSLGTFLVKTSPSGNVVLEKTDSNVFSQPVQLHVKDGIHQGVIELFQISK